MKKIINKYLTKNYLIVNDRFYSKVTRKLYNGDDTVNELVKIFASPKEEILKLATAWVKRRGLTPSEISNLGFEIITSYKPFTLGGNVSNRWILRFPELFDVDASFVNLYSRPNMSFEGNRMSWDDIEFELELGEPLYGMLNERLYNIMNTNRVFQYTLEHIDLTGTSVQTWNINGFVKSVNFGPRTYDDDSGMVRVTMAVNSCVLV